MSVNIYRDMLQHARLFGIDVLCTNWLIDRNHVPATWYCYDLECIPKRSGTTVSLVDEARLDLHHKSILSPIPLKRPGTKALKVEGDFYLHGEEMTLEEYCKEHSLEAPSDQSVSLRPAFREEAGLFYSDDAQDETLGTVGHLRLDFGSGGREFWHTWWPHNGDQFNTPEFKEILQEFVDAMRENGPLKNLSAMDTYCRKHGGVITEDKQTYGYIAETEHYRFCLRCTPRPGDNQGYRNSYDLRQQQMTRQDKLVGRITFASGEQQEFRDADTYLQAILEELPYRNTTGFRYETLTDDPQIRKSVDDILLDFAGEENPRRTCNYGLTEAGKQALRDAADPGRPHTYAWFVLTDCNTPDEQIHQGLTLEEAIRFYQNSNRPEKRLGVTKDGIATVDLVRSLNGEQQFFEDYRRLDSFRDDPVVIAAAETLHQALKHTTPEQGMTLGGM